VGATSARLLKNEGSAPGMFSIDSLENKATAECKSIENKPKCAILMDEIKDKGRDHVKKLTVVQLRMLLQYEFNSTAQK
jgi:hypothetical protein